MLVDVAVMLADGGETISDLAVLRDQPDLFGPVASTATAWRVLDGIDQVLPGLVIDVDAPLATCHSEKEAATFKGGS